MGLFKRMSDLLSANLNDLLDQCENPERALRQAVREMEAGLGQLMDSAARAIAHHRLLGRQLEKWQREIQRRMENAETALVRGDEQAARRELRQKAEHQRIADGLVQQVTTAEALSNHLREQVAAMRIRLTEARGKQLDLAARSQAATARRQCVASWPNQESAAVASSKFEQACSRIERSEAESEALLELLGEAGTIDSHDTEIEADLQALKEKLHHATH